MCDLPGRTGETFGKGTPGNNDTGAVDVSAATQKVPFPCICCASLLVTAFTTFPLLEKKNRVGCVRFSAHLPICGMQAEEGAAKAGSIIDKIKDALPFGTLPVFDLAELSKDDADMGPNEVTKEYLGTGFQNSNNPFDTAMPGLPEQPAGCIPVLLSMLNVAYSWYPCARVALTRWVFCCHRPVGRNLWSGQARRE